MTWPRPPKNEQPFCYFPATRIWLQSRELWGGAEMTSDQQGQVGVVQIADCT